MDDVRCVGHPDPDLFPLQLLAALGAYRFFALKPEVDIDFDVAPAKGQSDLWQ